MSKQNSDDILNYASGRAPGVAATKDAHADASSLSTNQPSSSAANGEVDLTNTPAFQRWFSNSKIVDAHGRPMVLYHGTTGEFSVFSHERLGQNFDNAVSRQGFFFTNERSIAAAFSWDKKNAKVGNILDVYLSIQNPVEIDATMVTGGGFDEIARRLEAAKAAGHDGAIIHNWADGSGLKVQYVAFHPAQIKSASANFGEFDPDNADVRYSVGDAPVFYSALERTVTEMTKIAAKDGMVKPEQARQWLQARQKEGRFKAEELHWSGVDDWLNAYEGRVAVADIANFVKQNGVQVQEVVKGKVIRQDIKTVASAMDMLTKHMHATEDGVRNTYRFTHDDGYIILANQLTNEKDKSGPTKYGKYTLPGGENYRELLLTLPEVKTPKPYEKWLIENFTGIDNQQARDLYELQQDPDKNYQSSHWEEANILAHIRFNDRVDADGRRVLFIEELQSDWGTEGLRKGFAEQVDIVGYKWDEDAKDWIQAPDSEAEQYGARVIDYDRDTLWPTRAEAEQNITRKGTPTAPFVTETKAWLSLGVKRMIRYAAEHGYDRVAFVNGQQSTDRYDLSKQVESITYEPTAKGYYINVMQGGRNIKHGDFTTSELEDIVGKDIVQKMEGREGKRVAEPGDPDYDDLGDTRTLAGDGLKMGGEGMKSFYDQIVPQVVNDVLKKVGGGRASIIQVRDGRDPFVLRTKDGRELHRFATVDAMNTHYNELRRLEQKGIELTTSVSEIVRDIDGGTIPQLGFDITDTMRQKALGGLPLFSAAAHPMGFDALRAVDPFLQALAEQGKIVLHQLASTLPVRGKIPAGVQALTTADGAIHVVASALTGTASGVVLHEAFHAGVHGLIGSKAWNKLQDRLGELYRQSENPRSASNPFWTAAHQRVESAKARGAVALGMEHEEFGAYAIEEYAQAPKTVRRWVDDLVGSVKAWGLRRFGKQFGDVTPAQLSSLAKLALLDSKASYDKKPSPAFSVSEQNSTPAFTRWFGDSKIVDNRGLPMVVYHGTNQRDDFTEFENNGRGIWFTEDPEEASEYATSYSEHWSARPRVMPVYVSISNPYRPSVDEEREWRDATASDDGFEEVEAALVEKAESMGHDGIQFSQGYWVALNAEQVKSAIGNSGAFDPDEPDIRYSVSDAAASIENPALVTRDLILDFADSIDPFGPDRDLWILARSSKPREMFEGELGRRFVDHLQRLGHDGATVPRYSSEESVGVPGNSYVTFSPSRIRIVPETNSYTEQVLSDHNSIGNRQHRRPRMQ